MQLGVSDYRSAGCTSMHQIADWLEKLGMSEYAQRFTENDIDTSVLPHLSDQDLKELGISLGHRRKMLAAIGELAGAAPATPKPVAAMETKPKTMPSAAPVFSSTMAIGSGAPLARPAAEVMQI